MKFRRFLSATLAVGSVVTVSAVGSADTPTASRTAGRASLYKQLPNESLEQVSTAQQIKGVAAGNAAPTEIWRVLEHGERVECLSCIPQVSKLLWADHPKTREISAWWLRRRIFGVFGPGQVYSQVVSALQSDPNEKRRAYAADALGEFLAGSGVKYVAKAAVTDTSPLVRKSAVLALMRLNHQGQNGELGQALSDSDADVRLAALHASIRVNVFTNIDAVAGLIGDADARVRQRAAENLGVMRAKDAVGGLVALISPDSEKDAGVRAAAVAALGRIADPGVNGEVRAAVQAAKNDPHPFVRDAASIALRRL
jgi:HEAT repeat protein